MSLYEETRDLLKNRSINLTFAKIEAKTENVTQAWLKKFSTGNCGNVGIHTVQELNDFLKTEKA